MSRMTARAALQGVARDGLVHRIPGRGTFVSPAARPAHGRRQAQLDRLDDAVALLDALAAEGEAGTSRLAHLLGRRRDDVAALLERLADLDLVERADGAGEFRLGLRLFRLGSAVERRLDVRRAARPVMDDLNRRTEETVYLCIRRGDEALCIERVDGLWVQSLALRLGETLPLHLGAASRVLLAHEQPGFRKAYLARVALERRTDRTPTTRAAVERELQVIIARGYAVSDGDIRLGIAAVGAPVRDHTGAVVAALSVGGLRPSILGEEGATASLVVAGAERISRTLGFRGAGGRS